MNKKIKLFIGTLSMLLLASCSSYDFQKDIKEYIPGTNKQVDYKNQSNKDILSDNEKKSAIFNRNDRDINNNLKGVWIATVKHLDFPTVEEYNPERQKAELITMLDNIKSMGLNAVFFQVRTEADALYNSSYAPYSRYITGTQGRYPGYDPLAFVIQEGHKRGLEVHAWINPYRAFMNADETDKISMNNIIRKHPEWVFEYVDGKLYFNPGNPEVVEYVSKTIEEIVEKYDVDGIHLDDYFYPYPLSDGVKVEIPDNEEFAKYGKNYATKDDWRRANVNNMIANLSVSVHKIKPNIVFGVSPFGIWRNAKNDLRGSNTNGLQAYDNLYADSLLWMKEGWVDYIAPQIYWAIGDARADYKTLVEWWSKQAKATNTTLYIGHGIYKPEVARGDELTSELNVNANNPEVKGSIYFRYKFLLESPNLRRQLR